MSDDENELKKDEDSGLRVVGSSIEIDINKIVAGIPIAITEFHCAGCAGKPDCHGMPDIAPVEVAARTLEHFIDMQHMEDLDAYPDRHRQGAGEEYIPFMDCENGECKMYVEDLTRLREYLREMKGTNEEAALDNKREGE